MFKKILIANRGEIALRVIRTCKEMGIKTVAVYSTADADSLHVRFADEAVCIGPPKSVDSYLAIPKIIAAAEITNADAIHPGYGFLSENAEFSRICAENQIKFIGASPQMIESMGDKASAKATMKAAGVPTIPGNKGILESLDEAKKIAKKIGYPVMLKATAGGGGKGMQVCNDIEELAEGWESTRREAGAAFGNDGMYMEKFVVEPRHIEIQIAADQRGKACHLSERDCSIQRRHQKLVEETPSPYMTDKLREKMGKAAIKAAEAVKYEGVGTVEFLVDANRDFYFMEMNTRIQVEHTHHGRSRELRPHQRANQIGGGRKHQRKELLSSDARNPMQNQCGRPGPQLCSLPRTHYRLSFPRWTWSSVGHPCVCGVSNSSLLRFDDCETDRRCADTRRSHPKNATCARRVRY